MTKPVILTGLRANNDLTLGNYFGGILPMIEMAKSRADEFQINMFIPDLHSFTTPIDHGSLQAQILHNARLFVAAGLPIEHDNIALYRQSYISAHSELTWILNCFTGFGEMSRMTQFKDKSKSIYSQNEAIDRLRKDIENLSSDMHDFYNQLKDDETKNNFIDIMSRSIAEATSKEIVSIGLFNYPVLMAADILLYNAAYVPVGEDQRQHIEFTRDIAERMNARFGELFTVPEPVTRQYEFFGKDQGLRIMDLQNPLKKMSKSDETGKGVIFLGDDPKLAHKKVMSAATDSFGEIHYDKQNQPGIANLLEILALLRGTSLHETAREFDGHTRYGDFKKVVADEVENFLTEFQHRLQNIDDATIMRKLEASERTVALTATETLTRVQQAIGLRPKVN